jgi:hypothetical protein
MVTVSGSTISTAAPQDVWLTLCDPLRFAKSWTGIAPALYGDAEECTTYSCTVSDRVFRWQLAPTRGGTKITVYVDIPDGELPPDPHDITASLCWLAEVVAVASERRIETRATKRNAPRPLRRVGLEPC